MKLYAIRHADSANNVNPLVQRTEDPPLTELGRWQAGQMARWLPSTDPDLLITSPFRRALETSRFAQDQLGLRPDIWTDLHEQGGCISGSDEGTFRGRPGMTGEEIAREFPGWRIPPEIDGAGWWKNRPYEPAEQAWARARRLATRLQKDFADSDKTVLLVSHGSFLRLLLAAILDLSTLETPFGEILNTAVSSLRVTRDRIQLLSFNAVGHLEVDSAPGVRLESARAGISST